MRLPRRAGPWWFHLLVAVVVGLVCRALTPSVAAPWDGGGHQPAVQQAFWPFLVIVGSLIWKGIEIAGRVTLEILRWMVINLSLIVTKLVNGLKAIGVDLLAGFRKAWDFLKVTYEHVLKPAWEKFWRWFDKLRKWLDDTFGPVLRHLRDLRDALLKFWKTYVRPWLDLIDVTRRLLRTLNSLGLKWAGELDRRLAAIEDAIERPFRLLLAKVNEIINLVNRVVTLDGLLQRVALIRSMERDYKFAWQAIVNPYQKLLTENRRKAARAALAAALIAVGVPAEAAIAWMNLPVQQPTQATALEDARAYIRDRSGPNAPLLDEMRLIWRKQLLGR
jgi:hypothetical protein